MKMLLILVLILVANLSAKNLHIDQNRFFGFNKYNAIYSNENVISFYYLQDFNLQDSTHAFNNIRSEYINYKKLDIEFVGANFNNIYGKELNNYNLFYFNNINYNKYYCYDDVKLKNIYNNINLIIKENNYNYEFLFELMPGADINDIKLKINNVNLDDNNNLISDNFLITQSHAYFENEINDMFMLNYEIRNNIISYENDIKIDKRLIIDPIVLLQGTYYGGIALDRFYDMDIDTNNNVYAIGLTFSTAQIAFNGYQSIKGEGLDAFMVKFDKDGKRLWGTYFGGELDDIAFSTKVKGESVVMAGRMSSENFVMTTNAHQKDFGGGDDDGFFVEFNKSGDLIYSTYYGGEANDAINGIEVDGSSVYITGYTESLNNISNGGYQNSIGGGYDAFLAKFDGTNLDWATYFGGLGDDFANNIVFKNNRAIIVGSTNSDSKIASNGYQNTIGGKYDGFFTSFRINGTLERSSYFGGNSDDFLFAVDSDGSNLYLLGSSYSSNLPANTHQTSLNGSNDGIIAKINANNLEKCSYFGGSLAEAFYDIKYKDNLYIVGATRSDNNIAINTNYNTRSGNYDAILLKMDNNLSPIFSSYLGGIEEDVARSVYVNDNIIIAGYTSSSNTFSNNGHQNNYNGNIDGFISYFKDNSNRELSVIMDTNICSDSKINIQINKNFNLNNDNTYYIYLSDKNGNFNNNIIIDSLKTIDSLISISIPRIYDYSTDYKLKVMTSSPEVSTISNIFTIYPEISLNLNDTIFCKDDNIISTIKTYPSSNSEWYLNDELINEKDTLNYSANNLLIGNNTLKVIQNNKLCSKEKIINIYVKDIPEINIVGNKDVCIGNTEVYYYESNYNINANWKVNGGIITSENSNSITIEWNNLNSSITLNSPENDSLCANSTRIEIQSTHINKVEIIGNDTTCIDCIEDYYIEDSFDNYEWNITGGEFLSSNTLSEVKVKWTETNGNLLVNYSKNNCSNDAEIKMNYLNEPKLNINPSINNVCLNEEIKFTTSDAEFLSFTWTVNNASIIEENKNNLIVKFNNLSSATINLIRKNNLNNNIDSIFKIINVFKPNNNIYGLKDTICLNDEINLSVDSINTLTIETDYIDVIEENKSYFNFVYLTPGLKNIKITIEDEKTNCKYLIDKNIVVIENPKSPILTLIDNIIYSDSEFNIWYEDGILVEDNNSNTITPKENSEYYAFAIDEFLCSSKDKSNVIYYNPLSFKDQKINIYPNPNYGEFNIIINENYNNVNIKIFDLFGNEVANNDFNDNKINYSLKIKSGFYLIKIHSNDNLIYTEKILIIN